MVQALLPLLAQVKGQQLEQGGASMAAAAAEGKRRLQAASATHEAKVLAAAAVPLALAAAGKADVANKPALE